MTSFISTDLIGRAAHALQSSREAAEARAVIVSAEGQANGVARGIGKGLQKVSVTGSEAATSAQAIADLNTSEATVAAALAKEAEEQYARAAAIVSIIRTQQAGVLRLFDLSLSAGGMPDGGALAAILEEVGTQVPAVASGTGAVSPGAGAAGAVASVGDASDPASLDFDFSWMNGDAAPSFSGADQLSPAMTITASARFDDLASGSYQRVFDFGNGEAQDNVWLGQVGSTNDMRFEVVRDGVKYNVTAAGVIVEGETALWTARVDEDGMMTIFKDGVSVAEGQGVTIEGVDRTSNLAGQSNFAADSDLIGTVNGYGFQYGALSDTQVAALIAQGDPWLPSYSFEKQWLAGEADPSFTGANQIGGAMTITASAQFDDLGGGAWQRIFDFGEGQYNGNIILGQHGGSQTDLVFQIMDGGAVYQVVAANALVEGERAVWTARVEADGTMAIFKNGDLLVSGAGFTPVAMDRSSGYVGHSNWSSDTPLIGSVYGIGIDDEALTDEMIKDLAQAGDPWQS